MIRKPSIHPLAAHHLRELKEHWGVEPTVEETLWIVALCERVLNPGTGAHASLIGIPERCGASDVWLWPMTVGASLWFKELACGWWDGEPERLFWALAFALAHGRDRDVLTAGRTREASAGMIREWCLSLSCTRAEIEGAVDRMLPDPGAKAHANDTRAALDWERLVAELEVASGLPAAHWVWSVSRAHTVAAWRESKRIIAAQGGSPSSGMDAADEAVADLARAKGEIVASRRGGAPPEAGA